MVNQRGDAMPARQRKTVAAVPDAETEDQKRKRLLRKAYSEATQALREKHRGDFETLYAEKAGEAGVEWTPRATPEQKAGEVFEALIEQYPHLLDRVPALRESGEQDEDDATA
jgi:hypothetical protein